MQVEFDESRRVFKIRQEAYGGAMIVNYSETFGSFEVAGDELVVSRNGSVAARFGSDGRFRL